MTQIIKRNGERTPLDVDRPNNVVMKACEGLDGVSWSEVMAVAKLQFVDGTTTERIQEILIKAAEQLITPESPNYQYVAARLQMYDVRKRAYGKYKPPTFKEHCHNMVKLGKYDSDMIDFTDEEFAQFEQFIDHKRDKSFSTAASGQLVDKYLIRDRTKHRAFFESPQMMYMAIAVTLLRGDMVRIKRFYDGASLFKFSLPTPIMSGVRTPTRQFSSCVLIKSGDTLDSIIATSGAIAKYVSKRAGIGVDESSIRGVDAPIRGGEMVHTGVVPFLKYHVGALKSCSQGGVRGGSATAYYPMWHWQFEDIIVLKNNRGIDENRERKVDYGIQLNGEMIRRLLDNEDMWFFSPEEVPEMYKAFFDDQEKFRVEYEKAITIAGAGLIRGRCIKAADAWDMMLGERSETGRIFFAFVDNMNIQGPFSPHIDPVTQSNLCLEIALPTRSFEHEFDEEGRIALCTLASFNMSQFLDLDESLDELMMYADALVRALDGLLSYQDYPMIQAKIATDEFRTLGVGIVNLADFLCRKGMKYGSKAALNEVNEWMERFAYALTSASVELAEEKGACERWEDTCYGEGKFPWELRNRNIDAQLDTVCDMGDEWESLRSRISKSGIRNATLMAIAPTESSSQVLNATNGVEQPKAPMVIKASKSGLMKQIVPTPELVDQYEYLWGNANPTAYLITCAVLQKWVDQSISTNTFYNPSKTNDVIERYQLLRDIIMFYHLGGKTLYYQNVNDGAGDELEPEKEPECDTCVV
ncbi:ribonucleotide reductase large subunit [Vibrio phage 1.244.A._10N.261.54.C3]|nr:ribonucleotide reductase large subunit [Vibrio phage 1.244.A._10N.261.54.C3]AUR98779.1 ribonucleotide reductase large subunit [Vibrio phage 1.255.O._10N.286.45.F1]